MKKLFITLVMAAAFLMASAVPAIPYPQKVTQPNGEELTVRIMGDEFYHYLATVDGYTIVKNDQGYYTYATLINDEIVPSKIIAHDAESRTVVDNAWLNATGKHLRSKSKVEAGRQARVQRDNLPSLKRINYDNFHGLVILVEFKDAHFTRSDVQEFYTNMINQENYTGYTNEDGSANPYGRCTGSVRDYFYDNSNGIFSPQFDVVGPYEVNFNVNQGNQYATSIFLSAVQKANPDVDFSQYDLDNNGYVDLIYFIYADTPSSSDSSSPNHIWPHRSAFYSPSKYDGKYIRDYACSAEYIYAKSSGIFDGIGTICHEFSHVLGLPDLYDTNENDDNANGEAQHPGEWDLMAGGNYQNNARTPVAYSLYDRYATGFANYQVITAEGEYTLNPIGTTGEGYILKTPVNKEIFLIDNRQTSTKWDAYAPGRGMTIARMDSTNSSVWNNNAPNGNANRLYYELLRAGGSTEFQSPSDPFPGSEGVAMVTNDTEANLVTFNGSRNNFILHNIRQEGNVIKFRVATENSLNSIVEDFEPMEPTTNKNLTEVQGSIAKWNFLKCNATAPDDASLCNGNIAIAMPKSSTLTMATDIAYKSNMIKFDVRNPNATDAKFQLSISYDQGATWSVLANAGDDVSCVARKGKNSTFYYSLVLDAPARFRLACTAGSSTKSTYIDDFTIYHDGELEPFQPIPGDVNGDGFVTSADVTAIYDVLLGTDNQFAAAADVNGDGFVTSADVTAVYDILLGIN